MKRQLSRMSVFLLLAAVFFGLPAAAHYRGTFDGDDSSSALDIQRSKFLHGSGQLVLRTETREPWRASALSRKSNGIYFDFDSRGGRAEDYDVQVYYVNGRLIATLWRWLNNEEAVFVARVGVYKKGRTVTITLKKKLLRPTRKYIRWAVQTHHRGVQDSAPNGGNWYLHRF